MMGSRPPTHRSRFQPRPVLRRSDAGLKQTPTASSKTNEPNRTELTWTEPADASIERVTAIPVCLRSMCTRNRCRGWTLLAIGRQIHPTASPPLPQQLHLLPRATSKRGTNTSLEDHMQGSHQIKASTSSPNPMAMNHRIQISRNWAGTFPRQL